MAIGRIGEPGRHLFGDHGGLNSLRPRAGRFISQQRKRRDLAGTMAFLAVLLENWKNVLLESGRRERSRSRKYKRHAGTNHPFTSLHAVYPVLLACDNPARKRRAGASIPSYQAARALRSAGCLRTISHPKQESASGHEDQIGGFGRVVGN